MEDRRQKISRLVSEHERWRKQALNMIASENALSPAVRRALDSDLVQRYGDYTGRDLTARRYRGNRYVELIEREAVRIAQETFHAQHVELRPISGHVAGVAVLMGICKPGDVVLEPGRDGGGHREGGKFASLPLIPLEIQPLPFDGQRYNVDIQRTFELIRQKRPRAVILGSSNYLFPHPVAAIAEFLKTNFPETVLIYDASHVMGLVAAGRFQDPLAEGADLVFGSTHKTLPGPQGGIIFSNRDDLMQTICEATYPALVTNHHLFRIPALALALLEMQEWGPAYADQIIANSQALGSALEKNGVPCVNFAGRYSQSHTLLACVSQFGKAADIAARLESAGIILTAAHLPEVWGTEGLRIGVQEITRMGTTAESIPQIANWMANAIRGDQNVQTISAEVAEFVSGLGPVRFTWDDGI